MGYGHEMLVNSRVYFIAGNIGIFGKHAKSLGLNGMPPVIAGTCHEVRFTVLNYP